MYKQLVCDTVSSDSEGEVKRIPGAQIHQQMCVRFMAVTRIQLCGVQIHEFVCVTVTIYNFIDQTGIIIGGMTNDNL